MALEDWRLYLHKHGKEVKSMAIDPVCGMDVDEQQAAGISDYQGRSYYFCSEACKERFDQNPQQYIRQRAAER